MTDKVHFYGDTELARIEPMLPDWRCWYIYCADSHITWHARLKEDSRTVIHSDSSDGLVCRAHEYDISMGR